MGYANPVNKVSSFQAIDALRINIKMSDVLFCIVIANVVSVDMDTFLTLGTVY